jgi:hypothetical protein
MTKEKKTVDVMVDLGDLKPVLEKMAKSSGVSLNEFVCDALESKVRRDRDFHNDKMVKHSGKHKSGKHTGYEVTPDGKYYPCPSWVNRFEELFAERSAIIELANEIVRQSQERLVKVAQAITKAKNELIDDLGLDTSKDWAYYGGHQKYMCEYKPAHDSEDSRDVDSNEN